MNNFPELLKQLKENSQTQTKETKTTHDLLKNIAVNFKNLKGPKRLSDDNNEDAPFSLKDDFEKFKGELKDSLSFVKTNLLGIKPSEEKIKKQTQINEALSKDTPNIIDSPDEIVAEESKKQSRIIDELLDTTKDSLAQLKNIGDSLVGTPEPLKKGTSVPPPGVGALGAGALGAGALGTAAAGSMLPNINVPGKSPAPAPDASKKSSGKETAKAASKGIGKSLIKKIPVVGAVAGLAFGASRLMQGDVAGAGMEVASGLAGTIPGVGTAASVGIDAALAAKDAGAFNKEEVPAPPTAPAAQAVKPVEAKAEVKKPDSKNQKEVFLTPDQEKLADPLISEMLSLSNQIKTLNDDFTIPKDAKKAKRLELVKQQKTLTQQLDKIKPELGFHVLQYAGAMDIDTSQETSKSLTEKMKQDFKTTSTPLKEEAETKSASKASGEKVFKETKTTQPSTTTVTGEKRTDAAEQARQEKLGLAEKYAQKAAPIVKKLYEEGKIEDGFATEEDYQNIPELAALRKERNEEMAKLSKAEMAGTSQFTDKSSTSTSIQSIDQTDQMSPKQKGLMNQIPSISTENAAIKDEMAAGGKNVQPVVMNNVSSNNQTTYVPVKGEPRPGSRGSALDRYNDRVAAY